MKRFMIAPKSLIGLLFSISLLLISQVAFSLPIGVSKINDVSDINQYQDAWGNNWCAPVAVANSMIYLRKQYKIDALTQKNGTDMNEQQLVEEIAATLGLTKGGPGVTFTTLVNKKPDYFKDRSSLVVQKSKTANNKFQNIGGAGSKDYVLVSSDTKDLVKWVKAELAKSEDVELANFWLVYGEDGKWHVNGGHWINDFLSGPYDSFGNLVTLTGYGEPWIDVNGNHILDPNEESSYIDLFTNGVYDTDVFAFHDPALDVGTSHTELFPNIGYQTVYDDYYKLGILDLSDFGGIGEAVYLQGYAGSITGDIIGLGAGKTTPNVGDKMHVLVGAVSESVVPEPSTWLFLSFGLFALIWFKKRQFMKT
ncbi:MAG: PEP-CTERM sorting domain-containing protein [Desulfobacterales bacterium]|nr:PEP-CTERM sorting domain-containing protein [Desulfobacterales bacterium]